MTLVIDLTPQKEKELHEAIERRDADRARKVLDNVLDEIIASLLQKFDDANF